MNLAFYLTQFFYRHWKKDYLQFEGHYSITDNLTGDTLEHSVTCLAKNEAQAQRIIQAYKVGQINHMEKVKKGFGLYFQLPETKKGKAKAIASMATGLSSAKRNFSIGFKSGGISPFALFFSLSDFFYKAIRERQKSQEDRKPYSLHKLYWILFAESFCLTLASIFTGWALFPHLLNPTMIYLASLFITLLFLFIASTLRLIKNNE